ncbi:AaceriABR144Cp [[Ashbya] aceris (nom. inval.)]|nr:AaceriABR144Cp [[Ashbya] aceris (nom. inval.)]
MDTPIHRVKRRSKYAVPCVGRCLYLAVEEVKPRNILHFIYAYIYIVKSASVVPNAGKPAAVIMGIFRRESSARSVTQRLAKNDSEKLAPRTIHDPILEAVNEAQPFEQAAATFTENENHTLCSDQRVTKDVFGKPVVQPDISNPTRSRDERPLDTIRGFEYAITGDQQWMQQLETQRYGFTVRPDFPGLSAGPYVAGAGGYPSFPREQPVFEAPQVSPPRKQSKRRGLFGRKK